ncbi:hypothetical protein ACF07U_20990 [Streptomyces californicus]|uniref:hypothetical protein n=1 Tax=Streptomyces californicus TaxID=67351 RepID=UPI0036FB20A2
MFKERLSHYSITVVTMEYTFAPCPRSLAVATSFGAIQRSCVVAAGRPGTTSGRSVSASGHGLDPPGEFGHDRGEDGVDIGEGTSVGGRGGPAALGHQHADRAAQPERRPSVTPYDGGGALLRFPAGGAAVDLPVLAARAVPPGAEECALVAPGLRAQPDLRQAAADQPARRVRDGATEPHLGLQARGDPVGQDLRRVRTSGELDDPAWYFSRSGSKVLLEC